MQKEKSSLGEVQAIIDALLKEDIKILDTQKFTGSDYLQIHSYCINIKDINRLLKIFIRSVFDHELSSEQRDLIQSKSLNLTSRIVKSRLSSLAILLSYEILFELADAEMLKDKSMDTLKTSYEQFKESYEQRSKNHIKKLKKTEERSKLRREFYQSDNEYAQNELKTIAGFLPKV